MPDLVPTMPIQPELLLLHELNHRINNEFASLVSIVLRVAAASANDEVKRALSGVAQLLTTMPTSITLCGFRTTKLSSTRRITSANCAGQSAERSSIA
jgi:two-component sensor histidine kinase